MKNDITYEYRVFTHRLIDVESMEVGICTSKVIKGLKPKDKVNGRFFHTSDTDEWFFCWNNELQKLNLKGNSDVNAALAEVEKLIANANAAVSDAKKTAADAKTAAADAKTAAEAAIAAVESIENKADKSEVESLAQVVAGKVDSSVVDTLSQKVDSKADKADVDNKADKSVVDALVGKVDSIDMDKYALKTDLNDYANKQFVADEIAKIDIPDMPEVPTKVSAFENDAKYLTGDDLTDYPTKSVVKKFVEDEIAYSGEYLKGKRLADNYLTFKPNETKTLTDEEFDKFFGGFEEFRIVTKGGEKETTSDFSRFKLSDGPENVAKLYLFDYERISMLNVEKDDLAPAMLMEYSTSMTASSNVKLGDVDIVIKPRVNPFPYNGDVYINSPSRLFEIELKNLSDKDIKLNPCIPYANRDIDGTLYSYIPSKWYTMPEFVLKAKEKKVLDRVTLNQLCGDTVATRINHGSGEKEDNFTLFDEIISLKDANHLNFTLINADSARALPVDAPDRAKRIVVANQTFDFWADKDVSLTDLDVTVSLKTNPMPYNARAYFTKPEQLFEVSLSNVGERTIEFVPLVTYEFNSDDGITFISNSYKDKTLKHILVKPGETIKLDDKQVNLYFSSKGFTKVTCDFFGQETGKSEFDILDADREITIDPENFSKITFAALKPIIQYGGEGELSEFIIGEGHVKYQVSPLVRLDDVTVTVKPKLDPLPAQGEHYFQSPASLFEVELKNNTANLNRNTLIVTPKEN